MIEKAVLEDILSKAVQAPSGDNAQPWEFEISGESIFVYNVQGRDATLYNFRERGSYLGHGALIENIYILGHSRGLEGSIELFPAKEQCVAKITFNPISAAGDDLLAAAIPRRVTNRKPYQKIGFGTPDKKFIEDSIQSFSSVGLRFIDGPSIVEVATAISTNEQLLFENRPLHDFLFSMIRWTTAEEHLKPGLNILTMEFPAPLRFLLRYVFSDFEIVQALNAIGLSKFIPKQSAAGYAASSAIGVLIMKSQTDQDFVTAGRAFQRMWLSLTERGMWLQPVGALPFLMQRIDSAEAQDFSPAHVELIKGAYAVIAKTFELQEQEKIMMMFRLGYGTSPTASSTKLPPVMRA